MTDENEGLSKQDKYKTLIEQTEATRWKPGQSGNPEGRPPNTKYISDYLREALQKQTNGQSNAELIALALIELSKDTKMRNFAPAIKELLDRTEGKVPETHKIEADLPITLVYKLVEGGLTDGSNRGEEEGVSTRVHEDEKV